MTTTYDSLQDTLEHIEKVRENIDAIEENLRKRGDLHDASKTVEPEKSIFDRETPRLRELVYGSPEYSESLSRLGVALKHHYEHNSHHPEHYKDGIKGMTLLDLLEMIADWKAAAERHETGDLKTSFEINRKRFLISDELYVILESTAKELGWI